jgi:uncharacterized protein (UPF0210 family)
LTSLLVNVQENAVGILHEEIAMKIRSITFFIDPEWPLNEDKLDQAGAFRQKAQAAYEDAGYEVQTTRLATIPFPILFRGLKDDEVVEAAVNLEKAATAQGFAYTAVGPALIDQPESYTLIPDLISATDTLFCCAEMATREQGISLPAVRACAEIIQRITPQDPNGFANLYFTALANVGPESPFFPAAYHQGEEPAFAIATEAASLAVEAFTQAKGLNEGVEELIASIEEHGKKLQNVAGELSKEFGIPFGGIDFSLAPYPEEANSLGTAIERMGVPAVGAHGSLAAAAILADAIDRADFERVGFSGLLLPQLEDATLAARAAEEVLSVKDLLSYAAVCGTGLDTIPLPGDISVEEISALLLDLAALAMRLDKPLTARLMPIPGKKAGEMTNFDFAYFANSRVMALEASPLKGCLAGDECFGLQPRRKQPP